MIETPAGLVTARGVPEHIRSDNGPEFTANAIREWLGKVGAKTQYIEPGSPWENGVRGELQRQVEGRVAGPGGLLYAAGGKGTDRAIPADLQPDQGAELHGLQATGVGDHPVYEPCARAGRADIASVKITWRMSGGIRKGKAKANQSGNVSGNRARFGLILYLKVVATTGLEPVT